MLNEFKRPMWNDGPAKQPWLNYFNEYERTHCCFGEADDDAPSAGEDAMAQNFGYSVADQRADDAAAAAAASAASGSSAGAASGTGTGLSAADFEDYEGIGGKGSHASMEAGLEEDYGVSGLMGAAAIEAAADRSQKGMDDYEGVEGTGFGGGYGGDGSFDIGLSYNELSDLGYADTVDRGIQARDQQVADAIVADQSALGRDVNVTVDEFGNYTYTGADKWSALAGEIGKAYTELSPTVQLGKTINEQGGISGVLGKAKDDFVDSISSIFSGSPSAKQTSPSVSNPQASLSGLQSLGAGTEFSAMQAVADKEQAELDAQIAAEYGMGLGQRAEEGYSGPSSLFSSGFDKGISQRMGENMYTDPNKVTVTELSGSLAAPAAPRADQVNVTPLSGSVTDAELAAIKNEIAKDRRDGIAEFAMRALAKGERDAREADKRQAGLEDLISGRQMTAAEEAALVNAARSKRAAGGIVYRNEGGEVEEKTKSAMELYLEKLGQPSKYTIPTVPMNTPSMAPPPDTSDPFALAEYRKNLARETMGNYLPYDAGGASSAINTFNENYYGGASNVSPYNVAQLASLYGLPRDAGTYEGIIGMLGGVRNEPPPPPPVVPDPEPEPVIVEEEDDDNWSMYDDEEIDEAFARGGGGIRDVLYRQTGGDIKPSWMQNDMLEAQDDYKRIYESDLTKPSTEYTTPTLGNPTLKRPDYMKSAVGTLLPGPTMPGHPDYPGTMPPLPPYPEPPYPEPPKPTYDPDREEAARRRARELQAIKIGKLDTAPQTTAEREALQASGGFYRDDEGEVRDAQGNFQKDFAYDYTPPPTEPDRLIPFPIFDDKMYPLNKPTLGDPIWKQPTFQPQVLGDTSAGPMKPLEDYIPAMISAPVEPVNINMGPGSEGAPMMGQQLQPTGLQGLQQGLQQGMDQGYLSQLYGRPALQQPNYMQNPNYISQPIRPSMQSQNMQGLGQNLQGFGMQSPVPFGTQQPFSSGFGGFGQPMMGQTLRGTGF